MGPIAVLFVVLGVVTAVFIAFWAFQLRKHRLAKTAEEGTEVGAPNATQVGIGVVTDFLDTLGIGSFATTTALFRFLKQVPDRLIPGTMNVGHTLPTVAQAYWYIQAIQVDPLTLILMIVASVAGAQLGAPIVSGFSRRKVQIGMGSVLLLAAVVIFVRQVTGVNQHAGTLELTGVTLAAGVAGNFVLGALMTLGIGLYAPCIVLVALLGMSTKAAFPIMMGSCAFLMPVASITFIKKQSYSPRAAIGLALGGIPAVLICAKWVTDLDIHYVNWLVIVVVIYTAATMLRSAFLEKAGAVHPAKGQT
jgi:uncharacterized membrane protein YfcA